MLRHGYGHKDQWNSRECPKINPHIYAQLIFHKGVKTIENEVLKTKKKNKKKVMGKLEIDVQKKNFIFFGPHLYMLHHI